MSKSALGVGFDALDRHWLVAGALAAAIVALELAAITHAWDRLMTTLGELDGHCCADEVTELYT